MHWKNSSPYEESVKIAGLPVQHPVLAAGQTEPDGEKHERERRHASNDEAGRPYVKPEEDNADSVCAHLLCFALNESDENRGQTCIFWWFSSVK